MIVDEEQRFGVAQKELLRQLRLEVDVLALERDADPAHLHMSLAGLRDISVIETPPEGRPPDPHLRRRVRRGADRSRRSSASSRATGRRSTSTTGSRRSRRPPRSCASSVRRLASSSPTVRWANASSRTRCSRFLARRRRRARLDDDHRVGARHPRREHADRRARRPARARPALPDPWPRRPARRRRARLSLLPGRRRSSRPRRARVSRRWPTTPSSAPASRSRCATSRSAAPATCSAPSSRVTSPRSASSSTSRCCTRSIAELAGRAARRRAAGPRRRARRRVRPCRLHRLGGAQDRSAPPARARRGRGRAAELRLATEDRYGPLPEPVENLFAIQLRETQARAARRRLPRLPRRPGHASGPVVLGSAELRELRALSTRRCTRPASAKSPARRGACRGARTWSML